MPERVTWEEKIVELTIQKAKEVLQEAAHLGTLKLDEPLTGEDITLSRPKKNPAEESLPKTSNVEGKEDKLNEVTKASVISALESLIKQYGEKYSPMGNDASPFEQNENNLMESAAYKEALKELEMATAELKQGRTGSAKKAYEAVRVLIEMDMGTTASGRSSVNPPTTHA